MEIITGLSQLAAKLHQGFQPAVTVGNFDGLHLGHQELFKTTRDWALSQGKPWGVISFVPHTRIQNPQELLFTAKAKCQAISEWQPDFLCLQDFDADFRATTPEKFLSYFAHPEGRVSAIVIGFDFRFGCGRGGDIKALRRLETQDIHVFKVDSLEYQGTPVSSSRVRALLQQGDMTCISRLLGRPYYIEGHVIQGQQLGRRLGFPTANLAPDPQLLPANGVYAARLGVTGSAWQPQLYTQEPGDQLLRAVVNIGARPTIQGSNDSSISVEAHIIDERYQGTPLYDKEVCCFFYKRLRPEQRFASLEELKAQITQDVAMSHGFFTSQPAVTA